MDQVHGILAHGSPTIVIIFHFHSNSLIYTDNRKNSFLVLGEVLLIMLMIGLVQQRKKTCCYENKNKIWLSLHCNGDSTYLITNILVKFV